MWRVALLVAAATLATFECASSQDTTPEGPWCGRENIGDGTVVERCHFTSYQECMTIMLGGTAVFCVQNPRYVAPQPAVTAPSPQQPAPARAPQRRPDR